MIDNDYQILPFQDELHQNYGTLCKQAPFVRSTLSAIKLINELVSLNQDDVIVDLGCGDGIILNDLVKQIGCRGIGLDLCEESIKQAQYAAVQLGVNEKIIYRQTDFVKDQSWISQSTVLANKELLSCFNKFLSISSNNIIIAYVYPIDQLEHVQVNSSTIYIYTNSLLRLKNSAVQINKE